MGCYESGKEKRTSDLGLESKCSCGGNSFNDNITLKSVPRKRTNASQDSSVSDSVISDSSVLSMNDEECKVFNGSLNGSASCSNSQPSWRPLVLFVPLRLGLSDINPDYYPSLKVNVIFFVLYFQLI